MQKTKREHIYRMKNLSFLVFYPFIDFPHFPSETRNLATHLKTMFQKCLYKLLFGRVSWFNNSPDLRKSVLLEISY